jgi:hypothetical protein
MTTVRGSRARAIPRGDREEPRALPVGLAGLVLIAAGGLVESRGLLSSGSVATVINPDRNGLLWIRDLTGGLNDTDAPQDLADNQCSIAQNVEWATTKFAQRRQGGVNSIHATEPWGTSATLLALLRHTPTADEGAAEMFGFSNSAPPVMGRLAAGNQFAAVTVNDAWVDAAAKFLNGVSLNGKFFIAGDNAVDRLHVWDGTSLRRVGISTPAAAPTVANTGVGTYAATLRYYKVHFIDTATNRISNLSDAVSFTPSGTGTHARVTRPTAPGDGENIWRLFGSPDGVNFYNIAFAPIATTTIDDNINPVDYATTSPTFAGFPTDAGHFTAPHSAKYVLADEDRLVLLSSWETASMASAVMWTPVLGTTEDAFLATDDERVPPGNRLDLDRGDGGGITGGGIVDGVVYVFKLTHIYRLVRTGNADLPYRGVPVTKSLGCVSHKSIVLGEDDAGNACLYFWSLRGPYRLSVDGGLEYLGRDIETGVAALNAHGPTIPIFGVWHQSKRQVQWWLTAVGSTFPDRKYVLHVRHAKRNEHREVRGGWAIHTEGAATCTAAVMFANTLGASMSLDLKPYCAQVFVATMPDGPVIKYDADGTYTDRGGLQSTYIGRVKPGAFPPGGAGMKGGITQTYVRGTPSNRALTIDAIRDDGAETRSATVAMPAVGSPALARALVKTDGDALAADAMYVELVLDDDVSPASSAAWSVDAIGVRVRTEGPI